jgi:hypothetical protein
MSQSPRPHDQWIIRLAHELARERATEERKWWLHHVIISTIMSGFLFAWAGTTIYFANNTNELIMRCLAFACAGFIVGSAASLFYRGVIAGLLTARRLKKVIEDDEWRCV